MHFWSSLTRIWTKSSNSKHLKLDQNCYLSCGQKFRKEIQWTKSVFAFYPIKRSKRIPWEFFCNHHFTEFILSMVYAIWTHIKSMIIIWKSCTKPHPRNWKKIAVCFKFKGMIVISLQLRLWIVLWKRLKLGQSCESTTSHLSVVFSLSGHNLFFGWVFQNHFRVYRLNLIDPGKRIRKPSI